MSAPPALPDRSGIASADGADAILHATTPTFVAWLRQHGLPDGRLREAEQLDQRLRDFQRTVLRYGLAKALIEKGYPVARDAAAWAVFDAAMQRRLQPGPRA